VPPILQNLSDGQPREQVTTSSAAGNRNIHSVDQIREWLLTRTAIWTLAAGLSSLPCR